MTDKRNNLDQVFATARTESPVVTFDETRARVDAHTSAGSSTITVSNTTKHIIMITSGLGILAVTIIGFLSLNSGDVDTKANQRKQTPGRYEIVHNAEAAKVNADRPFSLTTEQQVSGKPMPIGKAWPVEDKEEAKNPNDNGAEEEKDTNGMFIAPAPFISGIRMIELSREELGRLGLQPDTAGVWSFFRLDTTIALQCSKYGIIHVSEVASVKASSTIVPDFTPAVITDDFGNRRVEFFDNETASRERTAKTAVLTSSTPSDDSDSTGKVIADTPADVRLPRWQILDRDLRTKLVLYFRSQGVMAKVGDSIIVTAFVDPKTGQRKLVRIENASLPEPQRLTTTDKIHGELGTELYREIIGKEYEHLDLEPEVYDATAPLATGHLIPILVRAGHTGMQIDNTIRTNTQITINDGGGNVWRPDCIFWYEPTASFLSALPEEIRLRVERQLRFAALIGSKPSDESMEGFINRQTREIRQAFDSLRSGEEDALITAVAGEAFIGAFYAAAGAITSSSIAPNPARDFALVRYVLGVPRMVSIAFYDVRGSLIRELHGLTQQGAGEHLHPIDLKGMPPGMYLLVIATEKEKAIQRIIVE